MACLARVFKNVNSLNVMNILVKLILLWLGTQTSECGALQRGLEKMWWLIFSCFYGFSFLFSFTFPQSTNTSLSSYCDENTSLFFFFFAIVITREFAVMCHWIEYLKVFKIFNVFLKIRKGPAKLKGYTLVTEYTASKWK